MSIDIHEAQGLIYLRSIMNMKTMTNTTAFPRKGSTGFVEGKTIEYHRSFSQGHGKRIWPASYFSLESLLLLVCLTASLLILPLILPPLPPPPSMLLLLPICILGVLMILAFMPSNVRDIAQTDEHKGNARPTDNYIAAKKMKEPKSPVPRAGNWHQKCYTAKRTPTSFTSSLENFYTESCKDMLWDVREEIGSNLNLTTGSGSCQGKTEFHVSAASFDKPLDDLHATPLGCSHQRTQKSHCITLFY
ncbi:hypothetical protein RJ639_032918 [Escallonia herrerae]|uniref:Uncharacterized protein n=1 Tax=Escallonia herrerae TaxID=1293975 RepID=A0AA88XBK8_9ASTE|nr:hypothetical protein RJ639_032918 [Escallonia herrerae]